MQNGIVDDKIPSRRKQLLLIADNRIQNVLVAQGERLGFQQIRHQFRRNFIFPHQFQIHQHHSGVKIIFGVFHFQIIPRIRRPVIPFQPFDVAQPDRISVADMLPDKTILDAPDITIARILVKKLGNVSQNHHVRV